LEEDKTAIYKEDEEKLSNDECFERKRKSLYHLWKENEENI